MMFNEIIACTEILQPAGTIRLIVFEEHTAGERPCITEIVEWDGKVLDTKSKRRTFRNNMLKRIENCRFDLDMEELIR